MPKTEPSDTVQQRAILALPMSRGTKFYVEKAKRTTDCRICHMPIKVRRKRVRIEMSRLKAYQLHNGGMIFKTVWFVHVGCIKNLFGDEAGSRRYDCFACGRSTVSSKKGTRVRPMQYAWVIVSFSASYGRLCEDCAASPRWIQCETCSSYAAARHVEQVSSDGGVTVLNMCRACRRVQPEYESMVKVRRELIRAERKFISLRDKMKRKGPWLTRS